MNKLKSIINIIIAAFTGVLIGHGIYDFIDYRLNPEKYEFNSAPWYTSILVHGIFTVLLVSLCLVIKWAVVAVCKKRTKL